MATAPPEGRHLLDGRPAPSRPRAVVLMLHGGAQQGHQVVGPRSASWQRSRWMLGALNRPLGRRDVALTLLRFSVRGWNATDGNEPSPVADARWALDRLRVRYDDLPVVLLGHSMGARTALHVADHPAVVAVVGLAPWFPADEPLTAVSGIHLVAAHGSRDRITSARQSRLLLERAAPVAASTRFIDMGPVGHYMLTHVRRWNRAALDSVLDVLEKAGR